MKYGIETLARYDNEWHLTQSDLFWPEDLNYAVGVAQNVEYSFGLAARVITLPTKETT